MKTKQYKFGTHNCKAYLKTAGKGYEVGFHFGKEPMFVGNFLHKTEANKWWTLMNQEAVKFTTRYYVAPNAPVTWYRKFFSTHMYKVYYQFLDKQFAKYEREFNQAFKKDEKKYKTLKRQKNWKPSNKVAFRKAV